MSDRWPRDNMAAKIAFYGDPRSLKTRAAWERANLVDIIPPFRMHYGNSPLTHIRVHRKCATAFIAAFAEIFEKCGHDQKRVDATGASDYAGCYNPRLIRGSQTEWSNHSWGMAIDLSAATNGFNMKATLSQIVIDAFKHQGAFWGGDYQHRKDPMHFEFVSR